MVSVYLGMLHNPLIIFDSGIGGFSILKKLLHYNVPILYYADQLHFPYGNKTEEWIKTRLTELSLVFRDYAPRGLLLACNTATVTALSTLRSEMSCPVFGVEPVTNMLKSHKHPVIWATSTTTKSSKAGNLKKSHGEHIRYYTPIALASAIETGDTKQIRTILKKAKLDLGQLDAIGLSCTHYPLATKLIKKEFAGVKIYDPSHAVSLHIATTLNLTPRKPEDLPAPLQFESSDDVLRLVELAKSHGIV